MTDKNKVVEHDVPQTKVEAQLTVEPIPKPFPTPRGTPGDSEAGAIGVPFFTDIEKKRADAELQSSGAKTIEVGREIANYPFSAVGRLIFTWGGKRWHGSAWAVDEQTIVTAGHNVQEKAEWSSDFAFQLRYADGVSAEEVTVTKVYALEGWVTDADFGYDLAVCTLATKLTKLGNPLPVMGNVAADQKQYDGVGYPGEPTPAHDFDGKLMWQSEGAFLSASPSENAPTKIKVENGMTQGASGGPWIVVFRNGLLYANGVNSYGGNGVWMQSPYFGVGIENLLRASGVLPPQPSAAT